MKDQFSPGCEGIDFMPSGENSTNPFASPPTLGESERIVPDSYEIQGEQIIGPEKIILPHACVECGNTLQESGDAKRFKKDMYWVHPAIYILVVQLMIFLIVYLVTRKKCRVEYSLCRDCLAKRRVNWLYFAAATAVFIGMVSLLVNLENAWCFVGVLIAFVAMLTFAVRANGPLTIRGYKRGEFRLRGAGPEFLQHARHIERTEPVATAILAEDGRLG